MIPLKEKNAKLISELEAKKKVLEENKVKLTSLLEKKRKCDSDIKRFSKETDKLKEEVHTANKQVDKCESIYNGLSGERTRWQASVQRNQTLTNKVVGDCILAAAFLT